MAKAIDLTAPRVQERQRQVGTYGTQTPLSSTAVERGSTRWLAGSYVEIAGQLTGSGTFDWSGITLLSGATTIAGPTGITGHLTVQGQTDLNGPTSVGGNLEIVAGGLFKAGQSVINPDGSAKFGLFDIAANGDLSSKGTLAIDGVTTLKSDLNVVTGGKINVGTSMQLEPTGGGQINFTGGAISRTESFGMLINDGVRLDLSAPVVNLTGANIALTSLPPSSQKANLYVHPSGRLFVSTAV